MTMEENALNHLKKVDPLLYKVACQVLKELGPLAEYQEKSSEELFEALCESIVSQQLSVKAADTIFERFKTLLGEVTPENILKTPDDDLRSVGLSRPKVTYMKDLANHVKEGKIKLKELDVLPEEEVISELVAVKGIGQWTAEMFLMFSLGRPDVFSHGDLGLRNGFKKVYGEKSKEEMESIVNSWSPYKTFASRILWKSLQLS